MGNWHYKFYTNNLVVIYLNWNYNTVNGVLFRRLIHGGVVLNGKAS